MSLNILSWNVNGIRAVERKKSLEWLDAEKYPIICFQETKCSDESVLSKALLEPVGYHAYWHGNKDRKGLSGVAVYTKEKPKNVKIDFGKNLLSREGRVIELEYDNFTLLNIYFPNGKASAERLQYKMDFYKEFLAYVKKLDKEGKNVVFCGDVNTAHKAIDLARPKQNEKVSGFLPEERAWIDDVETAGFHDTLRMFNDAPELYTWWDMKTRARDRNVGWRIDYFFVNDRLSDKVENAWLMPEIMGSDHCPVGVELDL